MPPYLDNDEKADNYLLYSCKDADGKETVYSIQHTACMNSLGYFVLNEGVNELKSIPYTVTRAKSVLNYIGTFPHALRMDHKLSTWLKEQKLNVEDILGDFTITPIKPAPDYLKP